MSQQTGTINEPSQNDNSYWLNADNGPVDAYIVIDLGAAYNITSFDLFNTHNSVIYGDRGTGKFTIEASNSIAPGVGSGSNLSVSFVTLLGGTLSAANPAGDPLLAQTFTASDSGFYRYIRFSPHTVAAWNTACCGANVYGLNELRVFGASATDAPEPATLALLGLGFVGLGLIRKRAAKSHPSGD